MRRERCPEDRRQVLCWITARGRALLAKLETPVADAAKAIFGDLSAGDVETLLALLERLRLRCDGAGRPG